MGDWDVFVSYSRGDDAAPARTLALALEDCGLRVFWDDQEIQTFRPISRTILDAIGSSRVLLAYFSANYPLRQACQYELTAAFLAGQHEGDPTRRVLVVNPEPGRDHVHPVQLRDARHARAPRTGAELAQLATTIAAHVREVGTPIGSVEELAAPLWLPAPARPRPAGFGDRVAELWELHSALHPYDARLTAGNAAPVAVVLGPHGIGKTALVTEYAHRFGAAFPDGIFWLDGSSDAVRENQLLAIAETMTGAPVSPQSAANTVAAELHRRGARALWILDGVEDPAAARAWLGPHPRVRSVITSTNPATAGLGGVVELREPSGATPDLPRSSSTERAVAWTLQIELAHRIQTLASGSQLRQALTSLHEFFGLTRRLLRENGPSPVAARAYALLETHLRPLLTRWHPALESYEATRGAGDPLDHERRWPQYEELSAALNSLHERLVSIMVDLAVITGSRYGLKA